MSSQLHNAVASGDSDPLIAAWRAMDEEDHVVSPERVMLVAFHGVAGLTQPEREHLLTSRCEQCERSLIMAWSPFGPPDLLVRDAKNWPLDSTLATAMRKYKEGT